MSSKPRLVKVSSLPFKDVIKDFSTAFNVELKQVCSEYYINLPEDIGEGEIRGINFNNGLGLIIYRCTFKEDCEIRFTKDDIHPIKYLYTVDGPIEHEFSSETNTHVLKKNKCAMVASSNKGGHILRFKKNEPSYLVSLEIDRSSFIKNSHCELEDLSPMLKDLITDQNAIKSFYHEGFYGVAFLNLFNSIDLFTDKKLVRKLFLESKALDIFVNQIELFEDDFLTNENSRIFRTNEIDIIEKAGEFVINNLAEDLKVSDLANKFGINKNKLQQGFRYFYNMSVKEYVIHNRLVEASKLIRKTELSISEVADRVGFSNKSHFSKSFKNFFKLSPNELRD
jgi:AraC-like DNA-binding protein